MSPAVEKFSGLARALAERDGPDALAASLDMAGAALATSMQVGAAGLKNLLKFSARHGRNEAIKSIPSTLDPLTEALYAGSISALLASLFEAMGDDWQFSSTGIVTSATPALNELPPDSDAARLHVARAFAEALQARNLGDTMEVYLQAAMGVVVGADAAAMVARHFVRLPFSSLVLSRQTLARQFERAGFTDGMAPTATLALIAAARLPFYVRTAQRAALVPIVLASMLRTAREASTNPSFSITPHMMTAGARLARAFHEGARR
jgi:hypothetical protein